MGQSTLARANEGRAWHIYENFESYLIALVRPLYDENHKLLAGIDRDVFVLDSTTISVSYILMAWTHDKYYRGAVNMHTLLDLRVNIPAFIYVSDGKYQDVNVLLEIAVVAGAVYVMDKADIDFLRLYKLEAAGACFMGRAKSNLNIRTIGSRKVDKSTGLQCDQSIKLTVAKCRKNYVDKLRSIKYYKADKDTRLVFLTNDFKLNPLQIATIYKSRWQIEVFFRCIEQNLQIKKL